MQSNSFDICVNCYDFEILNLFDPELQMINTKPMTKNKFKKLLSELKKLKVQTILILDHKKINNHKIFHSSSKIIAGESDIHEAFKSMHQSIMTRIKQFASEDWVVTEIIVKHIIKIFECEYINGDNK